MGSIQELLRSMEARSRSPCDATDGLDNLAPTFDAVPAVSLWPTMPLRPLTRHAVSVRLVDMHPDQLDS